MRYPNIANPPNRIPFTHKNIECLQALDNKRIEVWDTVPQIPGFGIRVAPSGRKTWILLYRHAGRARRFTIGNFPTIGLADARSLARELLHKQAVEGCDPMLAKKRARQSMLFRDLVQAYLQGDVRQQRSYAEIEHVLLNRIAPAFGSQRISEITRSDIRRLVQKKKEDGSPYMANKFLAFLRGVFKFALQEDLLGSNPCDGIDLPAAPKSKDRVLSTKEIWKVFQAAQNLDENVRLYLYLLFLTAARAGEVRNAEWKEFDLKNKKWEIPGIRAKNGQPISLPIVAPLSGMVGREYFKRHSPYLFPSTIPGKARVDFKRALEKLREDSGVVFTWHDIRRTVSTRLAMGGTDRFIISRILNHTDRSVTAVYNRYRYEEEKCAALTAWSSRLLELLKREEEPAAKTF